MPSLRTSTRSLLELTPIAGSGILLPSATKMLPSVAFCQVEGWQAVMGPHEGTEHTQLLTAGQPHKPHDARDTRPLRIGWASGKESLVGRVCLGIRPAGERTSLEGTLPDIIPGEPGNLCLLLSPLVTVQPFCLIFSLATHSGLHVRSWNHY